MSEKKKDEYATEPTEDEVYEAEPAEEIEEEVSESARPKSKEEESLRDSLARLQADFENYRNRSEREREEQAKYAGEGLIMKLLPTLDNFQRAFQNCDPEDPFVKGMHLVYDELMNTLTKEGLEAIVSDGETFDPMLHHAVMTEEAEGTESGVVLETFQTGYKLKEKIIRPSMVKVSK